MIPLKINQTALDKHWKMTKESILKRVIEIYNKVKNNEEIKLGKGKNVIKVKGSERLLIFLKYFNSEDKLKKYLQLEPEKIIQVIRIIEKKLPSIIRRDDKIKTINNDYQIVVSIFINYGYNHSNFIKLDFINALELNTCIYCNRNYIYSLNKVGKIKPEIDHFYPKSIYPFLAASFYNLIPSCQTCNGFGGKGSEDTFRKNVVNPYLLKQDDFKFSYDIISLSLINPISSKGSIKVKLIEEKPENTKLFKLDELYEKHEDHVLELIYKSKIQYSEKYREYLTNFKGLHFSKSEIDRMIIGNYSELDELHKRPLSKLYRDIAIELGLID